MGNKVEGMSLLVIPLLLAFIGALIALGKGLISEPPLTSRVLVGLALLGAATSAIAGGMLHFVPNLSPPAIIALGCSMGLVGHVFIENSLKQFSKNFMKNKGVDNDEPK